MRARTRQSPVTIDGVSNPARMLADLLERWVVPVGHAVTSVRDDNGLEGVGFWKLQRMAASYLNEIEGLFDALDGIGGDTSDFRAAMDDWARAVFVPEQAWHGGASVETRVDPRDLRLLRALASQIDMLQLAPVFDDAQLTDLSKLLSEARQMINHEASIPVPVRAYIHALISEAEAAIADLRLYGESRLRSCSMELGGALVTTAGTPAVVATPPLRSKLGSLAFRIFASVGINLASHGAITGFDALIADFDLDSSAEKPELPPSE